MILSFLSGSSPQGSVANQIGIPTVTTSQMTDKVNGITTQFYTFFTGIFNNVAIICLILAVFALILSAVFFKKGMKAAGFSIAGIIAAIILFMNAPLLVGWISTMAK
ncbi:hypothetical protein [Clostridium massiliamazoniense]|uniref:hypothetical protein n=1 Tax=Clostridium massiliamazoniense TaxID=1347366 RepID=UPI0006D86157|nr:hypothetical protein [Clostridium massiliamazoniense]